MNSDSFLPEFESDELVDELGGVGDIAAHIDNKLKRIKKESLRIFFDGKKEKMTILNEMNI